MPPATHRGTGVLSHRNESIIDWKMVYREWDLSFKFRIHYLKGNGSETTEMILSFLYLWVKTFTQLPVELNVNNVLEKIIKLSIMNE